MVSKWYDVLGRFLHFTGPKFAAYMIEFIGSFFLVLTIGLNVIQKNMFAPIAIGSILMVMIFMGGHISGAHYNPAVTLGVRLTGRQHITSLHASMYVLVQVLGGLFASLIAYGATGDTFLVAPGPTSSSGIALMLEFFYTFALVSVMLNCATTKSQNSNSFFGLAIGFTVLAAAFSVGNLSGGAFNPAVATGPTILNGIVKKGTFKYLWIYWVGDLAGATFAAVVFRLTNPSEYRAQAAVAGTTTRTPKNDVDRKSDAEERKHLVTNTTQEDDI